MKTHIDGEAVMMDLDQCRYYELDDTGTQIKAHLAEPVLTRNACDRLVVEFDGPVDGLLQQKAAL